jgi:lipoprotein NlpI
MKTKTRYGVVMLLICIACHSLTQAQLPQLKINDKTDPNVYLSKLTVDVKIAGTIAITTMEMTFRNNNSRVLEGELIFPLPEGVSISRYALDINGRMREAVPVEKEKAVQVFEEIERRQVDPGLLEKVEGNNFRTRIYPMPANGVRTVIIAYEEELSFNNKQLLRYHLPLDHKKPVDNFKLDVSVLQSAIQPQLEEGPDDELQFKAWNNNYTASISKQHFIPEHSLTITLPKAPDNAEVMMQQTGGNYYFLVNSFPQKGSRAKVMPREITVLWDASLSGLNRDRAKELALLDEYLKTANNVLVHLAVINNTFREAGRYRVQNGNWHELKTAIEGLIYDGGTNYSRIQFPTSEEYIFFTDGMSSLSAQDIPLPNKPVYTISSAARSDFSYLQYIAQKTGGAFINLNALKTNEAVPLLTQQPLQFIGIKRNRVISETYPSMPEPVVNNFSVAGIVTEPNATITLQFGYGTTVTTEKTITLDFSKQGTNVVNLGKVWAQKKIGELDIQYEQNKELITFLGKRFSIVTRNTSLIVLETVHDYVRYEIEPPAELRGQYDQMIKQQLVQRESRLQLTLANALQQLDVLVNWWNRSFTAKAAPKPIKGKKDVLTRDNSLANNIIQGTIVDQAGLPMSGVTISLQGGSQAMTITDEQGRFRITKPAGSQTLQATAIGYNQKQVALQNNNRVTLRMQPSSNSLDEVVVVGMGTQRRREMTGSVRNEEVQADAAPAAVTDLFKKLPGLQVDKDGVVDRAPLAYKHMTEEEKRTAGSYNDQPVTTINIKQWTPERPYLQVLAKEKTGNRYNAYLTLRKDNLYSPTFYYDVANFFLRERDTLTGLQILTNMAEIDLENHELYKLLGYKLREAGAYEEALIVFKKVLQWRPQEPHSYRDYGLALADAGLYQQALDTLYTALKKNYSESMNGMYRGIEEIIVTEINQLISLHKEKLDLSNIDSKLVHAMPTDVRVVLNWNKNDTDMDLWVTDPNEETCYYSHKETLIGGRISTDFTRGYGPEQFLLKKAVNGKYQVKVNYYGDQQFKLSGPTTVMAEIFTHYADGRQERKLITLQMDKGGKQEGVLVGEFEFSQKDQVAKNK